MSHAISYDQDGQLGVQGHVICWKYTWLPEPGFVHFARLAPCPWESYRVPPRSCLIWKRVITTPASEGLVDKVPAYSKHLVSINCHYHYVRHGRTAQWWAFQAWENAACHFPQQPCVSTGHGYFSCFAALSSKLSALLLVPAVPSPLCPLCSPTGCRISSWSHSATSRLVGLRRLLNISNQ